MNIGPQTENRLKKLIIIWRALHEYVNVVHDPEKQYRSLSAPQNTGVLSLRVCVHVCATQSPAVFFGGLHAFALRLDSTVATVRAGTFLSFCPSSSVWCQFLRGPFSLTTMLSVMLVLCARLPVQCHATPFLRPCTLYITIYIIYYNGAKMKRLRC